MGISIETMLKGEYFRGFEVVAGQGGLGKHIQGVAVLDAPDGFNWTTGREFVISSGYVFREKSGLMANYVGSGHFEKCSCVGIKLGRFIDAMPPDLIRACDDFDIPLLAIPKEVSWMGIMNAINVMVMNSNIKNFDIGKVSFDSLSDLSYHVRKTQKILSAVENVMSFPAMVYYLNDSRAFYSSDKFGELSAGMRPTDFWEPPAGFSKEILCDNLKMARYRIFDSRFDKPYSWITVPITVDDRVRAYFVVLEATGLIDFYDQYALRTGYVLIQELYEQILVTQSIGDKGFETFVANLIAGELDNPDLLRARAEELDLAADAPYYAVLLRQADPALSLYTHRKEIGVSVRMVFGTSQCRVTVVDAHSALLLYMPAPNTEEASAARDLTERLKKLDTRLRADLGDHAYAYGITDIPARIQDLKRGYDRCLRTLEVGALMFPEERFLTYSRLGPLAWIHVEPDEIAFMRRDIGRLLRADSGGTLVKTLRAYLESQMNFSMTAKLVYAHINTVRRRIEEIRGILDMNLEDPVSRLKLELLLRLATPGGED